MDPSQAVLQRPFDIDTHKKTFINYLEVIIRGDGTIEYAVPSHQEKLIRIGCEMTGLTRGEFYAKCPPEYFFDVLSWLCWITNCVAVWNNHSVGMMNPLQADALHKLQEAGLYEQGDDSL